MTFLGSVVILNFSIEGIHLGSRRRAAGNAARQERDTLVKIRAATVK